MMTKIWYNRPVLFLLFLNISAKALEVTIQGARDSYKEGDDVRLVCESTASSDYTITWYKDGMRIQRDDNDIDSASSDPSNCI